MTDANSFAPEQAISAHLKQIYAEEMKQRTTPQGRSLGWIDEAVGGQQWERVRVLLRKLSPESLPDKSKYLYPKGMATWRLGQQDEAILLFEQAKQFYVNSDDFARAAMCSLEIADICHERAEYLTAHHFLDEAQEHLKHFSPDAAPWMWGRFHLLTGILQTDSGKLSDGIGPVETALLLFQRTGDTNCEFFCLMHLANTLLRLGQFGEATSRLQKARICFNVGLVLHSYRSRLLNTQTCLLWFRGDLEEAAADGERLRKYVDGRSNGDKELPSQQINARLLLGHIERAQGNYRAALEWYSEARERAGEAGQAFKGEWATLDEAWTFLLQGDYDSARPRIDRAMGALGSAQRANAQAVAGIYHGLQRRYPAAEHHLRYVLAHYEGRGDPLAACALRLHLAYAYLCDDRRQQAAGEAATVLDWMVGEGVTYIPYWWHPQIFAGVLQFARTQHPQHLGHIDRILRQRLGIDGDAYIETERSLADVPAPAAAVPPLPDLSDVEDERVRSVLTELLEGGFLRRARFDELRQWLAWGDKQPRPDPRLAAVLGLYLQGHSTREMAARLGCPDTTVRAGITRLYQIFGLAAADFPGRKARKAELLRQAVAAGYVDG